MDHILVAGKLALFVGGLAALDVTAFLQLLDGGAYRVLALPVDGGQAGEGVVPVLRQRQHLGQQSLGLQRQALIAQMIVAHHGIVPCLLDPKYSHASALLSTQGGRRTLPTPSVSCTRFYILLTARSGAARGTGTRRPAPPARRPVPGSRCTSRLPSSSCP